MGLSDEILAGNAEESAVLLRQLREEAFLHIESKYQNKARLLSDEEWLNLGPALKGMLPRNYLKIVEVEEGIPHGVGGFYRDKVLYVPSGANLRTLSHEVVHGLQNAVTHKFNEDEAETVARFFGLKDELKEFTRLAKEYPSHRNYYAGLAQRRQADLQQAAVEMQKLKNTVIEAQTKQGLEQGKFDSNYRQILGRLLVQFLRIK